jgi:hypothetical protein
MLLNKKNSDGQHTMISQVTIMLNIPLGQHPGTLIPQGMFIMNTDNLIPRVTLMNSHTPRIIPHTLGYAHLDTSYPRVCSS